MQTVFQRYEIKYLLTHQQKERVLAAMQGKMQLDEYGRTTIRNIYFDTEHYSLIRHSLDRPVYKEKLRLRSYRELGADEPVFVELKKKYRDVVYKRRLSLPQASAMACLINGQPLPVDSQIAHEIDYFRAFYQTLAPRVFLSYEREAFYDLGGSDFRVTFDENILYRCEALSLSAAPYGTPLLPKGMTLMELKTMGGMPIWMVYCLTQAQIFKTSFSKYGAAYQDFGLRYKKGEPYYA